MKAKKLIKELTKLIEKHGDFPVNVLQNDGNETESFLVIGEDENETFIGVSLIDLETSRSFE